VYVGLWLNRQRSLAQLGLSASMGIGLAFGGGNKHLFRLIADNEAEAEYMAAKHEENKRKLEAK
jgi:hypothetical protein